MNVVALVESEAHVCVRYRVTAFRPLLERAGVALTVRTRPKSLAARLWAYRALAAFDAVVVQRSLLSAFEVRVLRRAARRLVYDFDDALWMKDSYAGGFDCPRRARRFQAMVRAGDAVFAGNATLAAEAAKFAGAGRVTVIPTCVDPAAYPVASHARAAPDVRLAWVGSGSTLQGLDRARGHLAAVRERVPGATLRVICDRTMPDPPLPIELVPWHRDTEARHLAEADVGISWVPNDPWSAGKCGLKVLQYHAAGLPVVTNPVGIHAEFLAGNATGVLATTPAEWAAAVECLAANPAKRRALGAAGRAQVEARYSVEAGAKLWLAALGRLAAGALPASRGR